MIWLAIALSITLGQDPDLKGLSSETYAPPAVPPYEAPSTFGRRDVEGDTDGGGARRALTRPVSVEAYARNYETRPTGGELGYDHAVTRARLDADARMGPLDGRWIVTEVGHRAVAELVLFDRGRERPVEGAWMTATPGPRLIQPVTSIAGVDAEATLAVDEPGQSTTLRLHPINGGWHGTLTAAGRTRPVVLTRASP